MTAPEEDRLRQLAEIFPQLSRARLVALLAQAGRQHSRKKRGPRPAAYAKARKIAELWEAYQARHGGKSVAALAAKFCETLPPHLRPAGNARGNRKGAPASKTFSNVIRRGQVLNSQRASLRQLVALAHDCDQLPAKGTRRSSMARKIVRDGREGRAEYQDEIERLTRELGFFRGSAISALTGDALSSFIHFPEK